jgi:hypothetical protein
MMTLSRGEVVLLDFPFSEAGGSKVRHALHDVDRRGRLSFLHG